MSQQEIKVQEPADQVPVGHVPRSVNLCARGANTKQCSPGDIITITGVHLPTPYTGFHGMRAGLIHDTYVEVFKIFKEKKTHQSSAIS
jgi:DNA replication licensing factor MCM7